MSADCADARSIDVLSHAVTLEVALQPASLRGSGVVRVRARRALAAFVLDATRLRVQEARAGAERLRFSLQADRLCIELPRRLAAGQALEVALTWEGAVNAKQPRFSADQVWAGYRASSFLPTRSDPAQRASLDLRLITQPGLEVAASGELVSREASADARVVHHFRLERPSPAFLYAFAVGRFERASLRVDGLELRALGPPGSDLLGTLRLTADIYRSFVEKLGLPLPAASYTQVFVAGDAAQEAAGLALIGTDALKAVRDPDYDWVISHELAHQWFGWLIACADFDDFWLNEGFATFLTGVAKAQRSGLGAYAEELSNWRARSARAHAEGRDAPIASSDPRTQRATAREESALPARGITYFRGALLLHQLRRELGDATFWDAIRRYVRDRAGKSARTEDLRRALEAASGRSLGSYFQRWVYSAAPELGAAD